MGTARYYPPSFDPASDAPHRNPSARLRGWPYIVAAVAVLSAFTVFLSLCERDKSRLLVTDGNARQTVVLTPATQTPSVPPPASSLPVSDDVTHVTVPTRVSPQPAPVAKESAPAKPANAHVLDFTLARSRRLQQVGPLSVVVWKIDSKRKLFDLSVIANGHRTDRRRVALNSPVTISRGDPARTMQLTVTSMGRSTVSGFLSAASSTR